MDPWLTCHGYILTKYSKYRKPDPKPYFYRNRLPMEEAKRDVDKIGYGEVLQDLEPLLHSFCVLNPFQCEVAHPLTRYEAQKAKVSFIEEQ